MTVTPSGWATGNSRWKPRQVEAGAPAPVMCTLRLNSPAQGERKEGDLRKPQIQHEEGGREGERGVAFSSRCLFSSSSHKALRSYCSAPRASVNFLLRFCLCTYSSHLLNLLKKERKRTITLPYLKTALFPASKSSLRFITGVFREEADILACSQG